MRLLIAAAVACLSGCAAANSPESCRIDKIAELPIDLVGNQPLLSVTINGRPAKLLLDTGAEGVAIGEAAFEALGLERNYQAMASMSGMGAQTFIFPSRPAVLSLGPVTLPAAPMLVMVGPAFRLRGDRRADGLIGSQVLSRYDLDIDMPARHLGLYARRRCPDGPPPFAEASNTVRAEGQGAFKLTVPISVDGAPLVAEVDTGATRTIVDRAAAHLDHADLAADRTLHLNTADPVGVSASLHRFKTMQVGSETVDSPLLMVTSLRRAGYDALLGTDYWRTRRAWVSYGSRTITIGPP